MHYYESGLMVETKAWHERGNFYANANEIANAADGCKKSEMNWLVEAIQLSLPDGRIADMYAICRNTDGAILGYAPSSYELFQNHEAFELTQSFIDSGLYTYSATGSICGGTKCFITMKRSERLIVPGEKFLDYTVVMWSHDRSTAVMVFDVSIRVVCANTHRAALADRADRKARGEFVGFTVKHTKNMRITLAEVEQHYAKMNAHIADQTALFQRLMNRPVTIEERSAYWHTVLDTEVSGKGENGELTARQKSRATTRKEQLDEWLGKVAEHVAVRDGATIPGIENTAYGAYMILSECNEYVLGGNRVKDRGNNILFGEGAKRDAKAMELVNEFLQKPVGSAFIN